MRLMLVAALASTCGCDQLFGIGGSQLADAPPGTDGAANPDVPLGTLFLTQLQLVTPGGSALNDIVSTDAAISPAPTIEIGTLTGALTPAAYAADGTFQVPFSLAGQPYRIVYQLPGDIPTEIQWSRSRAHLTVPLWGPVDRGTVPTNSGVHFDTPAGAPIPYPTAPIAYSTGGWATGPVTYTLASTADWAYSTMATAMGGPLADLTSAAGDYELLLDRGTGDGSGAIGYAWQQIDQLQANTNEPGSAASTWETTPTTAVMWTPQTVPTFQRLTNDGVEKDSTTEYLAASFGGLASAAMPAFSQPPANGGLDGTVAIELANLAGSEDSPITFVNPFASAAVRLPTVVIGSASYRKIDDIVSEYSGFEEAALVVQGQNTQLQFDVGLAVQPTIDSAPFFDGAPLSVSDPTITLAFNLDDTSNIPTARTDDCIATLMKNAGGTVTPMRRYQVLDFPASIVVDTAQFTNATSYVFRIQCRRGYPLAHAMGDYRTVDYPFEAGVAFTPTFVAMK